MSGADRKPDLAALLDPDRPLTDDERARVEREDGAQPADPLLDILAAVREQGQPTRAFTGRVMREIEDRQGGVWRRLRNAVLRPRTLRFSLATAAPLAAAAAAMVALTVSHRDAPPPQARASPESRPAPHASRHAAGMPVTFSLPAPAAKRVVVAGDFNDWDVRAIELRDDDGDGVWTTTVELDPGRYAYKFLVDGERWVLDRNADAIQPDDFGGQNSVLKL